MSEPTREEWHARAVRAHAAMDAAFGRADGALRRDGRWHLPWTRAHLWPFTRALVGRADLLGVDPAAAPPDLIAAIERQEAALERYWDATEPGAYASDVPPRWRGTDRYHDDNAWVGLALIELERLAPAGRLGRVAALWRFAQSGWDRRVDVPHPGGVFWVEQGRGIGRRNHDRNAISTAPNAQIALHLTELLAQQRRGAVGVDAPPGPREMLGWVRAALGDGELVLDKIRGDGSVDRATWSYNQGSLLGAHALLAREAERRGDEAETARHRARGEAIARRSLATLGDRLDTQPAAFHAIWFRNLLLLADVSRDGALTDEILATLRRYAARCWNEHRRAGDLLVPPLARGRVTLLDQSAFVQILALLAWPRERWSELA